VRRLSVRKLREKKTKNYFTRGGAGEDATIGNLSAIKTRDH
jgi:hypothetical protein